MLARNKMSYLKTHLFKTISMCGIGTIHIATINQFAIGQKIKP